MPDPEKIVRGLGVALAVSLFFATATLLRAEQSGQAASGDVGKLASLVAQSGYQWSRIDESTWRVVKTGRVLPEIAIFVGESAGAAGFVVKIADRSELSATQSVLNSLLAQNSELSRAKLSLANSGDLLLSSSGSLRVMDLAEFRSHVEEIAVSADIATEKLRSTIKPTVPSVSALGAATAPVPAGAEPVAPLPANLGAPVEFGASNALGPRRKGRGGRGTLIVQPGAIAYRDDLDGNGSRNTFSATCSEIRAVRVDEAARNALPVKPARLRIELKGQTYELYDAAKDASNARTAVELIAAACR